MQRQTWYLRPNEKPIFPDELKRDPDKHGGLGFHKTIPLEEAKKLATPGKLIPIHGKGTCFHEGNLDSIQWECGKDGEEAMMETVAEIWPTSPPKRAKIGAALLAHRWNTHDALIEALEDMVEKHTTWSRAMLASKM